MLSSEKASPRGAICLIDSTDILIKNNLIAEIKIHKSYRVTSTAGSRFADVKIPLNDFIEVSEITGYTQYPNGKKVRLTQQDIGISSAPGFRGFGGIQVITFSLPNPVVGSKLYFQYKLKIKSLLYLPRLAPRADCPTERIAISLNWQSQIKPRFDSEGFNFVSQDSLGAFSQQLQKKDMKFYAENLPEIPEEPFSCPMRYHVLFSADKFSYGKSKFNSVSWQEVGYFFSKLATQPPEKIDELKSLSAKLSSTSKNRNDTLQSFFSFVADSVAYVALQVNKGDFTPHSCDIILSRRFGDCKDQSVLLASLCRAAGFEAYPALIATGDIPEVSGLFPWPSWFDHVVTVVKSGDSDIILDPSDHRSGINSIPPRLRGKSYLVCDGVSGLQTIPVGPKPSNAIDWSFEISSGISDNLSVIFNMVYANDASAAYGMIWQNDKTNQGSSFLESQLKYAGWDMTSFDVNNYFKMPDSLAVSGAFTVAAVDMGDYLNLSIPSPLSTYLLQNLFPDVRVTDYCNHDSYRLEETIALDNNAFSILPTALFSDSWRRAGFEFTDEFTIVDGKPEYHRVFEYSGDPLSAADYNAFRDFLLSRKDQQYVRIPK